MSLRYLLDTDTVVDILRRRHRVGERLAGVSPDHVGVSAMTVAELLYGAMVSHDRAAAEHQVNRFLGMIRIHPFGQRVAPVHARLRHALRSRTIGPNDLVIAATAVADNATLVTSNAREFERVTELRVESWRS